MSVFARNNDISCVLVPLNGMSEGAAIFIALQEVLPERSDWWRGKHFADSAGTHLILVLCRTQMIRDQVQVVTDIPDNQLAGLKQQVSDMGLVGFDVKVNLANTLVYY